MQYSDYLAALREPFIKLARLRFLQPDGTTAFALDNGQNNKHSGAFISSGELSFHWGNGRRRSVDVTLQNIDGDFDYNVNHAWFGTEIALDEGLVLPDGTEFYLPQGVYVIETPTEELKPSRRTITYHLVDKVANLDGTLSGNLEGTYEVEVGTNIFEPIAKLLAEDRGNGLPVDAVPPVFTKWYDGKTQTLPDGTVVLWTDTPSTLTINGGGSKWGVIDGLCAMLNAWVGYDETGALRVDPSQDDILDTDKPVIWNFSMESTSFLGAAYTVKNTDVYNDYIVVGEALSDERQPSARAQNFDPASDTNIMLIGRKTYFESAPNYWTDQQCKDLANWRLKKVSVLQKAVSISCSQIFHLRGNDLVTITRTDRPGNPVERHLITGFTRPLTGNKPMTIEAVSTQDIAIATLTEAGNN